MRPRRISRPGRWSLRAKLTCSMVALLAVVCLITGVASEFALGRFLDKQTDQQLRAAADRAMSFARGGSHGPEQPGPQQPGHTPIGQTGNESRNPLNGLGQGPGAILNSNNSLNTAANPATKGDTVVLFLTGEGQTSPPGVTGKVTTVAATGPLTPGPLLPISILIGPAGAQVAANFSFAGEAPGFVSGAMQLNVQIPLAAASGVQPIVDALRLVVLHVAVDRDRQFRRGDVHREGARAEAVVGGVRRAGEPG